MTRLKLTFTLILGMALPAGLVSAEEPKGAATHQVAIKGFEFAPKQLTVRAGDKIVWTNEDIVPHTATAQSGFDSKEIASKKSWTFRANRKGKFPYVCTYHPTMKGELTVE